ncbi:MAG: hypothetical protein HY710_00355 [Candidatus Latescibacteria bacterium]|nr:hypothetical protein [Candidatus Latescibacterota bacterium]
MFHSSLILLVLIGWSALGCGPSKELLLAGPLLEFQDRTPIPEPPKHDPNQYYDFVDRSLFKQIKGWLDLPRQVRRLVGQPKQAMNVDAFDEVPNSTWFTNRALTLSVGEALCGPDTLDGPDQTRTWEVRGAKTQGVTPGFTIRDRRGDTYLLKFDPPTNSELATGAEVISTKLVYAAGYNVPENYLVFFTPDQLRITGNVMVTDQFGRERAFTEEDLERILRRVPRMPDGRIRAIASKYLPGKPKGPFAYIRMRKTDPNDVFPQEHRRELRGLRVVAAFINHDDIRRINSLDMYTQEGYLRHYLIDFGSTLGSAAVGADLPSNGYEYRLDFAEMSKSLLGLGLYQHRWQRASPAPVPPSIGIFSNDRFHPHRWKPAYPNLAFQRMTNRDGFWGARLVMSLSNEKIEGIVKQAQYSDPTATAYMIETLIARRDQIGRYWYRRVNPLDRFTVTPTPDGGQVVRFVDLAVEAGFEAADGTAYRFVLMHNDFGGVDEMLKVGGAAASSPTMPVIPAQTTGSTTTIVLSPALLAEVATWCDQHSATTPGDRLFYLKIFTRRTPEAQWGKWVRAHLLYQRPEQGFKLAGIEREE